MDILFDQTTYDINLVTVGENVVDLAVVTSSTDILMQRLYLRFKTYQDQSYANKVAQMDAAGLSPGLMYGGGGANIVTGKQIGRASCRERV